MVRSFIYLSDTQPDISQVVYVLNQFVSTPTSVYYVALFRVFRYVRSTISRSLYSFDSSFSLRAYSDAGWADEIDTCRSTTGFCIFLSSSLISWRIKHQNIVSRSSTEAGYRALADTTLELRWLYDLLCDIGVSVVAPVPMHCDNKSSIAIASKAAFHDRTKHIEIDYHITRQKYEKDMITLPLFLPELSWLIYSPRHRPQLSFATFVQTLNV